MKAELAHLTLGAGVAFVMGILLMLLIGGSLISWLAQLRQSRWEVREDTPETHQKKQGTPSMGGIGIAAAVALTGISVLLLLFVKMEKTWDYPLNKVLVVYAETLVTLAPLPFLFFSNALLGWADDWSKLTEKGGMRALVKFSVQVLLALIFLFSIWAVTHSSLINPYNSQSYQQVGTFFAQQGWWAIPICVLAIVAMGNAANLTDGLDGLAAGLSVMSLIALALVTSSWTVQYLLFAVAGAALGFLWFNRYPAKMFMGDTGSLALGAIIGGAGILLGGFFLLPFVGFVMLVEMASVLLQVVWFKYTRRSSGAGKRLFKRAPLHHHFELSGWSERRIVWTFWGINFVTTIIGLWLWGNGVLPRWPG